MARYARYLQSRYVKWPVMHLQRYVSKLGAQKIGFLLKLTSQSRVFNEFSAWSLGSGHVCRLSTPHILHSSTPFSSCLHHFFIVFIQNFDGSPPIPGCPSQGADRCRPWPWLVPGLVAHALHDPRWRPKWGIRGSLPLGFSKKRNGENLLKQCLFGEDVWILDIANCDVFFGQCLLVQWENASESRGFAQSFGGKSS